MRKNGFKIYSVAAGQGSFGKVLYKKHWSEMTFNPFTSFCSLSQYWLKIFSYTTTKSIKICVNVPICITHAADWLYSKTLLGQTWFCSDDWKILLMDRTFMSHRHYMLQYIAFASIEGLVIFNLMSSNRVVVTIKCIFKLTVKASVSSRRMSSGWKNWEFGWNAVNIWIEGI